jgi:hypothetical protein
MKTLRLILVLIFSLSSCEDNNHYVTKLYNESISVRVPATWKIIEEGDYKFTDESLNYNKFIGEKDQLSGLQLEVYGFNHFEGLALDDMMTVHMDIQKLRNTGTRILNHEVRVINGNKIGDFKYLFEKNNEVWFGETVLIIHGKELFKMNIYSMHYSIDSFKTECSKIVESIKLKEM